MVTTVVQDIFLIEEIYFGYTCLGLCLIVPGTMMIVGGSSSLQKMEMRINEEIYTTEKVKITDNEVT